MAISAGYSLWVSHTGCFIGALGIGALGEGLGGCASAVLGRVFGWVGGVSYVYLRVF